METSYRTYRPLGLVNLVKIGCSDAAAALVGSLGLVPSVNAGDKFVMGEPFVVITRNHLAGS